MSNLVHNVTRTLEYHQLCKGPQTFDHDTSCCSALRAWAWPVSLHFIEREPGDVRIVYSISRLAAVPGAEGLSAIMRAHEE